jgi:flagellar hook protein FlgE
MTISSALNAGVAGLNANATRLATISDNIANSGTFGYKRANTDFQSMVIAQSQSAGSYSAGGVRATTSRLIDARGPLVGTANALDIAVSGRGMLPVAAGSSIVDGAFSGSMMMTSTGAFRADVNGTLRTDSGLVLLGWAADANGDIPELPRDSLTGLVPITIGANQLTGNPTTAIKLGVNLPATSTAAAATGEPLQLPVEYFGNLGTSERLEITFTPSIPASGSSNEWTLMITDTAQAGATIGEYTLTFDSTRGAGGTLASVTTISGGTYDAANGTLALTVAGGPLSMTIGRLADPNGLTQLSDSFTPTGVTKDGSPVGSLVSVEIDNRGYVNATYNTGFIRRMFQVPLVDVPNINGLMALSNQTYQLTRTSGPFFMWNAGDGPTGSVAGYTREGSTTDVAAELTALIQTQRAYSTNAKVIQTVDEMLQETTNLKR